LGRPRRCTVTASCRASADAWTRTQGAGEAAWRLACRIACSPPSRPPVSTGRATSLPGRCATISDDPGRAVTGDLHARGSPRGDDADAWSMMPAFPPLPVRMPRRPSGGRPVGECREIAMR
jgi:hypothetical protein